MHVHPTGRFDNSAKPYRHIEVVPLGAAMGAEVRGVQVASLTDSAFGEIADALWRHKMIFLRAQDVDHSVQEAFTLRFGEFGKDAYTPGVEGHPNIQPVRKEADSRAHMIFGGAWHTDSPFLERPPAVTILYGRDIPPYGGDTMWANLALSYAFLSDTMKEMLRPLRVRMSARDVVAEVERGKKMFGENSLGGTPLKFDPAPLVEGWSHPLVRTHPETGERALYVDDSYAVAIEGMTEPESDALLKFLRTHITQPAFTCRLRWEPGTLTMWDNRLCIHHAFNDHDGHRREMFRTTVMGEVPA